MSEERIGDKFLRKLYEKTVSNGIESIDGNEIGIIDVQMDNLVNELIGRVNKENRSD